MLMRLFFIFIKYVFIHKNPNFYGSLLGLDHIVGNVKLNVSKIFFHMNDSNKILRMKKNSFQKSDLYGERMLERLKLK